MNATTWEKLPDFELAGVIPGAETGSASCWLSPSVQVEEKWFKRVNRTAWMRAATTDETRDEVESVLSGPGVYLWLLPTGGRERAYRFLHVGKASASIEARQKEHFRNACNGKDHLWYPDGDDIKYGKLVYLKSDEKQPPLWSDLKKRLSPVRILCISLPTTRPDVKSEVAILESALLQAAVAHFAKQTSNCGWCYVSNSQGRTIGRIDGNQRDAARTAMNAVLPKFFC